MKKLNVWRLRAQYGSTLMIMDLACAAFIYISTHNNTKSEMVEQLQAELNILHKSVTMVITTTNSASTVITASGMNRSIQAKQIRSALKAHSGQAQRNMASTPSLSKKPH